MAARVKSEPPSVEPDTQSDDNVAKAEKLLAAIAAKDAKAVADVLFSPQEEQE